MTIERQTKIVNSEQTYEWSMETTNNASIEAFKDASDGLMIRSDGWYWELEDLEELKEFIDTLIREAF